MKVTGFPIATGSFSFAVRGGEDVEVKDPGLVQIQKKAELQIQAFSVLTPGELTRSRSQSS